MTFLGESGSRRALSFSTLYILPPAHTDSLKQSVARYPPPRSAYIRRESRLAAALFGGKTGILSPLRSESAARLRTLGSPSAYPL